MQEVQETNSELLRATNKELRHYKDTAALCPITQEPITNEVVNVVDGFKYERSGECLFFSTCMVGKPFVLPPSSLPLSLPSYSPLAHYRVRDVPYYS